MRVSESAFTMTTDEYFQAYALVHYFLLQEFGKYRASRIMERMTVEEFLKNLVSLREEGTLYGIEN